MKQTFSVIVLTCYLALQVTAFPHLEKNMLQDLIKREAGPQGCPFARDAAQQKKKRQLGFDPVAQHVSTTGEHAFAAPNLAAGDKRGPCPGLNALANHGYLPHNGIAPATTIVQAVTEGMTRLTREPKLAGNIWLTCPQFTAWLLISRPSLPNTEPHLTETLCP